LDRNLRVIANEQGEIAICPPGDEMFQSTDGTNRRSSSKTFPEGMSTSGGSPIEAGNPVSIEALRDGTVLILDVPPDGPSRILRYRMSTCIETVDLPFKAHDFAVCDDCLYVASSEGNQAYAFTLSFSPTELNLEPLEGYFPMRRFGGKALVAAQGREGTTAYYDFGEHWIPLVSQSYPRHVTEAVFQTQSRRGGVDHPGFDGKEPQCVWYRLVFDGCLPPGTEIEFWSRAADNETDLVSSDWIREPDPYRRGNGSEQPYVPAPAGRRGTFELLLQKARGRYLQLQVRLVSDGRLTPRIHALRIYYPRFSYMERYLPAVYRENKESASFLDRFLANIEGTATSIEDRIASAQMLFDVQSAPPDSLPWLASWFGVTLDPAWDEQRSRLLLRHAMTFFQWRGTIRGLKMALRLTFDATPTEDIFATTECGCGGTGQFRIVEKFQTRRFSPVQLGNPSEISSGPNLIYVTKKWIPNDGASALHASFLAATHLPTFTLIPATNATDETARTAFASATLGFVPSDPTDEIAGWTHFLQSKNWTGSTEIPLETPTDATLAGYWRSYQLDSNGQPYGRQRRLWQQFLARRYISVRTLAESYGVEWASFDEVVYPVVIPQNSVQLRDWFEFEARVLPTLAAAHRFTVLLPVSTLTSLSEDQRRQQLALANRLIELEKPAHTTFDVKFFWAMFRIGEARLGTDSVVGLGARDPAFLHQLAVAGQSYLGESFLHSTYPPSLPGRFVAGRDRLKLKHKPQ
jgi:phage tail-like protein